MGTYMGSRPRIAGVSRINLGASVSLLLLALLAAACDWLNGAGAVFDNLLSTARPPDFEMSIDEADMVLVWQLTNVLTFQNDGDRDLAAGNDVVALVGTLGQSAPAELIVLQGESGNLLWKAEAGNAASVDVSPLGVFLGTRLGQVQRFEMSTGSLVWSHQTMDLASVAGILVRNDALLVRSSAGTTFVLEEGSGQVKASLRVPEYARILLVGPEMWLSRGEKPNTLTASRPSLSGVIWQAELDGEVFEPPIVSGERIYVRTGAESGTLYCIDRSTGDHLWQFQSQVLGNLAADGDTLFVLGTDGRVQKVDGLSGRAETVASFQPSPFPLRPDRGGYYLGFDQTSHHLYIAIGDSDQLFALGPKKD
jgi:outer membrane protein assembly factor BamB